MKTYLYTLIYLVLFLSYGFVYADSNIFTRNLNVGSTGQDVLALKKILKLDLGVIDNQSSYNELTSYGVTKLQNKYASEILTPNGLTVGTGVVGAATRAKLNQLAVKYGLNASDFVTAVVTKTVPSSLSLGSNSSDVALFKSILNSDLKMSLPITNIFDQATKDAVKQFQEKYASDILIPNGLTIGNGVIGASTRNKLNSLLQKTSLPDQQVTSVQFVAPTLESFKTSSGKIGDTIIIYGKNFTQKQIYLNFKSKNTTSDGIVQPTVVSSTQLQFNLPTLNSGAYSVSLQYPTTSGNSSSNSLDFNVTDVNSSIQATIQPSTQNSDTKTLCPMYSYSYGDWGPCGNNGMQTRTITETKVGEATCPYQNIPKQSATQSCTPACMKPVNGIFGILTGIMIPCDSQVTSSVHY